VPQRFKPVAPSFIRSYGLSHEDVDRKSRLVVGSLNSGLAIVCASFSRIGRWCEPGGLFCIGFLVALQEGRAI